MGNDPLQSMQYIFSAIGGSGSTYLIRTLSQRYRVGNKPDTVFYASIGNICVDQGRFEDRANGFTASDNDTLADILPKYVDHLRKSDSETAVFNVAAEQGLFSKYSIPDVVFLIRHPMHAFVSWGKPERHKAFVDDFGGLNSSSAINFYGQRWKATVEECLRLKSSRLLGGIIRFEFAVRDANKLRDLDWVFEEFDSTKRNFGYLEAKYENELRRLVEGAYFSVYDDWNI